MKYPIQHITFEITQECNLHCFYCYNYWRRKGSTLHLTSFKETKKTVKRIVDTIDFQHVTITGGEPFLADGLEEIVLNFRMKGKGVTVITNGTAAKQSSYQMLIDLGVALFEIPFHSFNSSIHDLMTGHSGSFEKILESIRFLKGKRSEICLICVLTKINCIDFHKTLEAANTLGINRFMLARFNIGGRGIENANEITPSLAELRQAFSIANDFVKINKMIISSNVCVPFCIIDPDEYPNIPISSCGSDLTKRPVTIDSFGNMRMCNHSPQILGNIYSESVNSILNSEYANAWHSSHPHYCLECTKWTKCRGGCRAASEQMGRSLNSVDPLIEFLDKNVDRNNEELIEV
jgi:radical SAM protein with 4Fe4S-binding SPASM domain